MADAPEPGPDDEPIEWPREIWAVEREESDLDGRHVFSKFATVPRWEGDRDCEFHQYIDSDIYDSAERYYKHQLAELEAENERLRETLRAMKKPPQTIHGTISIPKETDQ